MKCPKCGFVQPESPECLNCGIFVERYRPEEERPASRAEAAQGQVGVALEPAEEDPFQRPIRSSLRFVRTGAGVVGVAVGAWLFLAGQQLDLKPLHVLSLIGYGCISLFWILSAPIRVPVRQFAVEMLIFVAATLMLRVALPEAFELGRLSNKTNAALNGGFATPQFDVEMTPRIFVNRVDSLTIGAREVLDDVSDKARAQEWFDDCQGVREVFRRLSAEERGQVERIYKAMIPLETRMKEALAEGAELGNLEGVFSHLEALERLVVDFVPPME